MLNEPNANVSFILGDVQDTVPLSGWISLYLDPNDPYNGRCQLGDAEAISTEDLIMLVWPGQIEAYIYAGHLQFYDFDIWYQDPNEWSRDPNLWPDPNDAQGPGDADDPNYVDPWNDPTKVDPNDPNFNGNGPDDPNDFDPNYNRWADLVNGVGILNSEVLFHWGYYLTMFGDVDEDASTEWTAPFSPWNVLLESDPGPGGDMVVTLDWTSWIKSDDFPARVPIHIEARGGIARSLNLEVSHPENGYVIVDPNLARQDKYPDGIELTLTAVPDPNGKGFNKWEVIDPADSNNNYQDTNLVLNLTMDRDWEVKAKFACGSAALMPLLGLTLLALGAGVVYRRWR